MAGDAESYASMLEDNRWVLVRSLEPEVFLDYLRQYQVLSEEDCQCIQNRYVNMTRRARMGCFLDILRTKGPDSVHMFSRQLGWEYPHVYQEIFGKEPEKPPVAYRQDKKSRLSCNLDKLLRIGVDFNRIISQKEDLADQVKDMEAMLKLQKNEIEDLEREHQRLRQYERNYQQDQERLHSLNAKNEEIKEENRQFLHEIRTLTLEIQKRRDQEAVLQSQLDEMTQQMQEKSFELNRKSKEENDLRVKFEKMRKESLKFQSPSLPRRGLPDVIEKKTRSRQDDLQQQIEILTDDMRNLEETNRELCDKLQYMQNLLDVEKNERDQMHRRVCILEHDKNTLESRQITSSQKIERFYNKIKELEEQKRKMEEERIHMQTKAWGMSQASEKQFEQLHKMETRYDKLQQSFERFRQDHRYCTPNESVQRPRLTPVITRSPGGTPHLGKEDPFKDFNSFYAKSDRPDNSSRCLADDQDGVAPPVFILNPVHLHHHSEPLGRSDSMKVQVSTSMKKKASQDAEELVESEEDDVASTLSDLSSISLSTFDPVDAGDTGCEPTGSGFNRQQSADSSVSSAFFIRSNFKEDCDTEQQKTPVNEGDILFVNSTGQDHWKVTFVDKASGKLCPDMQGSIPNPDRYRQDVTARRNVSPESNKKSTQSTLQRKPAVRRDGLKHQHSSPDNYIIVCPMRATRLLPVLLLCPPSAMESMLSCMEETAQDWADIIQDGHKESSTRLFAASSKHNVLQWDYRPKDPPRYDNNLHKFIIIIITLESQNAIPTLRILLGDPHLLMDFEQEMKYLKERLEIVQRAGLHYGTVTVVAGQDSREEFWKELSDKVSKVQNQVFWLEQVPRL